jgi:hypothetical protein
MHPVSTRSCSPGAPRTHVQHRAGLGVQLFVLMQLDLQRLHHVADDFVFHASSVGARL